MGRPVLERPTHINTPSLYVLRSSLSACFSKDELEGQLSARAHDGDAYRVSGLMLVHDGANVLGIGDLLAVNGHNQVSSEHDGGVAHVSLLVAAVKASPLR